MKGLKYDDGKPMMHLLEPKWIVGTAEVLTMGAKKYAPNNWKRVNRKKYEDAIFRHLMAYLSGEKNDIESGKSHLYHINCCSMFLDYFDRKIQDSKLHRYGKPVIFDEVYGLDFKYTYPYMAKFIKNNDKLIFISTPKTSRNSRTKRHK